MGKHRKVKPKRVLGWLLTLAMVLVMLPATSLTAWAYSGSGTEAEPYVVAEFEDLRSLIKNAPKDGSTRYIKLGADIINEQNTDGLDLECDAGQQIDLDLNGHVFSRIGLSNDNMFYVWSGGKLTIRDSAGGGMVESQLSGNSSNTVLYCREGGEVIVEGGTFISNYGYCLCLDGTAVINGGTFKTNTSKVYAFLVNGYLTMNGGHISCTRSDSDAMLINGGSSVSLYAMTTNSRIVRMQSETESIMYSIPWSSQLMQGTIDSSIRIDPDSETGLIEIKSDVYTTEGSGTEADPYVVVDAELLWPMFYSAPRDGSTRYIRLGTNLDISSGRLQIVNDNIKINLDLNGHTLTTKYNYVKRGSLTIGDSAGGGELQGSIDAGGTGQLTINGGSYRYNGRIIDGQGRASVIINDGSFYGECYYDFSPLIYLNGDGPNSPPMTCVINGGRFINTNEEVGTGGIMLDYDATDVDMTLAALETNVRIIKTYDKDASGIMSDIPSTSVLELYGDNNREDDNDILTVDKSTGLIRIVKYLPISSVDITGVVEPAVGETPKMTADVSVTGADKTKVAWFDWDGNRYLTDSDKFEADHTYMLMVTLEAREGYAFETTNSALAISVNGSKGFLGMANSKKVTCCCLFDPLPAVLTGRVQFTSAANVGKEIQKVLVGGTLANVDDAALHYQWEIHNGGSWEAVTVSNGTERNYIPTAEQAGKELRIVITADGYEGSVVSDGITVTKQYNPAAPTYAPTLRTGKGTDGKFSVLRVTIKRGQDYVWREGKVSDLSTLDWSVNAITAADGTDYADVTGLTEGSTYYVYTRFSETDEMQAGAGIRFSSIKMQSLQYLQKVILENYSDYGDGNTIYIPVGETVTIGVGAYPTGATSWSNFTFGDPSLSTAVYEVTSGSQVTQGAMPSSITLKGNGTGIGTLKAYYNGGMYDYGSWGVRVYDPSDPATYNVSFTDRPRYEDKSLTVGDSFTPESPDPGLMLPSEANDRYVYKWYVYEGVADVYGSPYGMTGENGYLRVDPDTGRVTALSAELDANKGSQYQPYVNLYAVNKNDSSQYTQVTSYKVTVNAEGEIPAESIAVLPSAKALAPGGEVTLQAVVSPTNHTSGAVIWSRVSGSDAVTVDAGTGRVTVAETAVSGTTATIRASVGSLTSDCLITVSDGASVSSMRLGGANRYETAALIAKEAFPEGADEMILVTGSKFPDALAASGYAGAKNCPLLITSLKALKPEIQSLLTDTWKGRVKTVTIIGGGFDPAVSAALRACGVETIKTIAGADRYETAEKIFLAGLKEGLFTYDACVVATGATAADALSVSPWTYKYHMPILLAKKGNKSLTPSEQAIVKNFNKVYIVGSEGVVNDPVVNAMTGKVERLAGNNRYETSVKIAKRFAEPGTFNTITFASGKDNSFPDALCGAMLAGQRSGPVILVSGNEAINAVMYSYLLRDFASTLSNDLYFFGAANVLSDTCKDKIESLF